MEKIGNQKIFSYFDSCGDHAREATNQTIRAGVGHTVRSYIELAKKIAELQFLNRDQVLLFRGQKADFLTAKGNSLLKPSIFRPCNNRAPSSTILANRFRDLKEAESELTKRYTAERFLGRQRLQRQRILRWAILQHYRVCDTPLLDVTTSLRIAASFASLDASGRAYVFVFGVPNIGGSVTASSEAGLEIVRLSSVCPPNAVRPHIQEGYLLGEYPEIADFEETSKYSHYEMDFGRRLMAKFQLDLTLFWKNPDYPCATTEALYPNIDVDQLRKLTEEISAELQSRHGRASQPTPIRPAGTWV
jgi:hypothetical protein